MPPRITSTWSSWTSFAAAASAALSVVSLSSRWRSSRRPRRPPAALMSSMTILATLALATPMNESAPVWSVITPTLMGPLMTRTGRRGPPPAAGPCARPPGGSPGRRGPRRSSASPRRPSRTAPRPGRPRWGRGRRTNPWSRAPCASRRPCSRRPARSGRSPRPSSLPGSSRSLLWLLGAAVRRRWSGDRTSAARPPHRANALPSGDEVVLVGPDRRRGPAADTGLLVDVLDVVPHGLGRDAEIRGDLLVGLAAREHEEDLQLALGQPGRQL